MHIAEPTVERFPNRLMAYFAATRPAFILATVIPIFLGLGYCIYEGHAINWLTAILTLLAGVLLHAGINVLNDYYDALNGTDELNEERVYPFTGGSRFIQNAVLSRKQTFIYGIALILVVMAIGTYLISHTGITLFWLGLFGILLGWGYSAPPLNLNSRGVGELSVLAGFSLLPLGTYLVQTGTLSGMLLLVSLPVGLLTANLLYINQFPDRKADIQAHKLHWVARLSPRVSRWGYVLIALLAWLTLVALILSGVLPLLAGISLLPAILSIKAARILLQHAATPRMLTPAIQMTILAMLTHGALLTLALVMASFFGA
ncbi:MAG: prenyltransferase [Thiohalomonadales bacterium]|nr:prenyltransferase [Thiohalomonadales bacterium]